MCPTDRWRCWNAEIADRFTIILLQISFMIYSNCSHMPLDHPCTIVLQWWQRPQIVQNLSIRTMCLGSFPFSTQTPRTFWRFHSQPIPANSYVCCAFEVVCESVSVSLLHDVNVMHVWIFHYITSFNMCITTWIYMAMEHRRSHAKHTLHAMWVRLIQNEWLRCVFVCLGAVCR